MAFGTGIGIASSIATLQEARVRQAEAASQAQRGMIGPEEEIRTRPIASAQAVRNFQQAAAADIYESGMSQGLAARASQSQRQLNASLSAQAASISREMFAGQQWGHSQIQRGLDAAVQDLSRSIDQDIVDTYLTEENKINTYIEPQVNCHELGIKYEVRRRFKNLFKIISRRANRTSDLDINAPMVPLNPIADVPVPRTVHQDQWTMDQIMTYTN